MKLKCLIADDNEQIRLVIKKALSKMENVELVGEADNGIKAVELMEQLRPHCVLIDVEMPGGDGVTAAKQMIDIDPMIMIVFITAHEHYMPQAFELYAFDYMVKPFRVERLRETINRMTQAAAPVKEHEPSHKVYLKTKDGNIILDAGDIMMAQRENRMTAIVARDGKHFVSETLSELEEKLPCSMFMRSHRSYIINMRHIKKMHPYGRWTYIVKFTGVPDDALITADKAKELTEMLNTNLTD